MRWHLLKSFDKIWVLDLHGNANKKEIAPDGSSDKNVFDIQQGVALIIAIRKGAGTDKSSGIWHGDLWGSRESKSDALWGETYQSASSSALQPKSPYFMFEPESTEALKSYSTGFSISELFGLQCTGIISARDNLAVDFDRVLLDTKVRQFLDPHKSDEIARLEFFGSKKAGKYAPGDSRGWKLSEKRRSLSSADWSKKIAPIQYRPFDFRAILYDQDMVDWPRLEVMGSFATAQNIALLSPRMTADNFSPLVTSAIVSNKTASRYDQSYFFPLYLNPDQGVIQTDAFAPNHRTLNLDPKLYAAVCKAAGIARPESAGPDDDFRAATGDARPSEIKVFDYIYGVLHSPDYRATYAEFLKIDFPRIPYPASSEVFRHVSEKGEALRRLHLMEAAAIGETSYRYDGDGDDLVASGFPKFEPCKSKGDRSTGLGRMGMVYINNDQYFDGVPEIAWTFYIGGYQPAQKWLKDRRGRGLSWGDIGHYQKIVKILSETDRIMKEIELPIGD
jgi:predicted helicase